MEASRRTGILVGAVCLGMLVLVLALVAGSTPSDTVGQPEMLREAATAVARDVQATVTASRANMPTPTAKPTSARTAIPTTPALPSATTLPSGTNQGAAPTAVAAPPPPGVDPTQAVMQYYERLEVRDYDGLIALSSDRLKAASLSDRDAFQSRVASESLVVERADLESMDEDGGRAVVAVRVLEVIGPWAWGRRHYVGTWGLLRTSDGWVLDEPSLHIE